MLNKDAQNKNQHLVEKLTKSAEGRRQLEAALECLSADIELIGRANREPLNSGDNDMLAVVAQEALQGVDIEREYPQFYQQMLANPSLAETFFDLLESLEDDISIEVPPPPAFDLSFLHRRTPLPKIQFISDQKWIMAWRYSRPDLQQMVEMSASSGTAVYRRQQTVEDGFTILHCEVNVADYRFEVLLEALLPLETDGETMAPQLAIREISGRALPPLTAELRWSQYEQITSVSPTGMATFPAFPLEWIADEEGQITAELHFTLQS